MKQKVEGVWYENPKCEGDSSCPLWSYCDTLFTNECYPCFDKPRCTPPASTQIVQEGCPMLIQSKEDCVTRCIFQPNERLSLSPVGTECVTNCSSDQVSKSLKCVLTGERAKWNQTIPDWLTVRERAFTTLGSTVFTSTPDQHSVSLGTGPESLPSVYDPISVMIPSNHVVLFGAITAAMLIVLTVCVILLTKSFNKLRCRKKGTSSTEENESLQGSNSFSSSGEVLDQNLNRPMDLSNGMIVAPQQHYMEMNLQTAEPNHLMDPQHGMDQQHIRNSQHGIGPYNEINHLQNDGDQLHVDGSQQFLDSHQERGFPRSYARGGPEEHDEGSVDFHLRSIYSLTEQQHDAQHITDSEISSHLESLNMRTASEDSNVDHSLVDIYHQTC